MVAKIAKKTQPYVLRVPPLTPRQREIYDLWFNAPYRYLIVSCGRQVGKSHTALMIALKTALKPLYGSKKCRIGYFMPYIDGAKLQYKRLVETVGGKLQGLNTNDTERKVTFANGSTVRFLGTDNPKSIRGNTFDYIIVDEACFVDGEVWQSSILATISIALSAGKGKVLLTSTPKDKNWFYDYFITKHPEYVSIKFTSAESGLHTTDQLNQIRSKTPAAIFANEYEAEFSEGSKGIFDLTRAKILPLGKEKNLTLTTDQNGVVAAVDWGMAQDYTVLVVLNTNKEVIFLKRWRQSMWHLVIDEICSTLRKLGNPLCYCETNGIGNMPTQELRRKYGNAREWVTTADSKSECILRLAEDLISPEPNRRISLPNVPYVLEEFENFGFEYIGGKMRFKNMNADVHDDTVMAIAIANVKHKPVTKFL